uniref:Interleukin-12 subunit beta n=1 Tax=Pyxicephalus adspersus TaxID=30357 RepID=A0AAV3B4J7_PYXAD|nr:TPA: hypothetical protein GDO54_006505 [Pyxicephalus adspersus]
MILSFTLLCLDPVYGAWELDAKKNTMIVDIDSDEKATVNVKCRSRDHQTVCWRKKKRALGCNMELNLKVKEQVDGGNFTCHSDNGLILDYKLILLHMQNVPQHKRIFSKSGEIVKCSVKSYSGNFSCSWNSTDDNNIEYIFKAYRSENNSIYCDEPTKNKNQYTVECRDTQTCIYEEEDQSITVVLHAIQLHRYENYTMSFMLREITKPDPPQELDINSTKDNKHILIHWKYPKTWCNLHSFFPLIFNVQITKDKRTTEADKNIKSFCVQARDKFFNSTWSEWSCYK